MKSFTSVLFLLGLLAATTKRSRAFAPMKTSQCIASFHRQLPESRCCSGALSVLQRSNRKKTGQLYQTSDIYEDSTDKSSRRRLLGWISGQKSLDKLLNKLFDGADTNRVSFVVRSIGVVPDVYHPTVSSIICPRKYIFIRWYQFSQCFLMGWLHVLFKGRSDIYGRVIRAGAKNVHKFESPGSRTTSYTRNCQGFVPPGWCWWI